jgi:predicted TIM-barrel fold metal-dependent hydrolase
MLRKQKTDKKYADFIKDCEKKRTFSIKEMLAKHKVDAAIITTMRQEEIIVSVTADVCNWIESAPNAVMISRIIESHRERVTKYRLAREHKVKQKQIQEVATRPAPTDRYRFTYVEPEPMNEEGAVAFLKSIGGYEIYKVERKQL